MVRGRTRLTKKREGLGKRQRQNNNSWQATDQASLWTDNERAVSRTSTLKNSERFPAGPSDTESQCVNSSPNNRSIKVIQDLLFPEGVLAAKLSVDATTVEDLLKTIEANLRQNSSETRRRYARSLLRWFFFDGLDGLARKAWTAYHDDRIESDILRYLYLSSEPIMAACVADALFPLQEGITIPASYFDRFLNNYLGSPASPKTRKRVKMNLVKLGFLKPVQSGGHRLNPMSPTKTAFYILLHHLFAPVQPRTIELRHVFADPFWKYLGLKSEDAVRGVIREANASGLLGKYVVADELEQITTCLTFAEIVDRGLRL